MMLASPFRHSRLRARARVAQIKLERLLLVRRVRAFADLQNDEENLSLLERDPSRSRREKNGFSKVQTLDRSIQIHFGSKRRFVPNADCLDIRRPRRRVALRFLVGFPVCSVAGWPKWFRWDPCSGGAEGLFVSRQGTNASRAYWILPQKSRLNYSTTSQPN